MPAALPNRRILSACSAVSFALVFAAILAFERPGLGIGRFFFVSVILLGLAGGLRAGAAGGLGASALYAIAVLLSPRLTDARLLDWSMGIRVATFVGVGILVGYIAGQQRALMEYLRLLAERDSVSGLPRTRAFETEITARLDSRRPFALLLGDLGSIGDEDLHRLPALLGRAFRPGDAVARVGPEQFAVLAECRTTEEAGRLAALLESVLASETLDVTLGWAASPQEGTNALALVRAADERLYARRLIRRPRLHAAG